MRVLFVVDSGPRIGGGHVMRSLTLARALAARGAEVVFLAPPAARRVLDAFAPPEIGREPSEAETPEAVTADAAGAAARFDAVAFDHFRLDAEAHRAVARGRPALAIDDMADRPMDADLLVDFGPERTAADYAGLIPERTRLLLGPAFGLVRPEFAALREATLRRRRETTEVRRVLVSLGLTDLNGITGKVVLRLLPRVGQATLDVVLGAGAASLPALERLAAREPRLRLHVDTPDMAALVAGADLAVGAGGSTTWERCTLGLPSVSVLLAENQEPSGRALARLGAQETVDARADDFEAALDRAFTGLFRSADRRARMASAAAAVCDGRGAERVADAFLEIARARA